MFGSFRDWLGYIKKAKDLLSFEKGIGGFNIGFSGAIAEQLFVIIILFGILFYMLYKYWEKAPWVTKTGV